MGSIMNLRFVAIMGVWVLYFWCRNEIVIGASASCSPVLLMNCIGSQKNHPSNRCCISLRSFAEDKCFCSRLRQGAVDPSNYTPIARACGIPVALTAKCK
ncbi:hypothetical protein KI387_039450, partial [Taxus chinensis]